MTNTLHNSTAIPDTDGLLPENAERGMGPVQRWVELRILRDHDGIERLCRSVITMPGWANEKTLEWVIRQQNRVGNTLLWICPPGIPPEHFWNHTVQPPQNARPDVVVAPADSVLSVQSGPLGTLAFTSEQLARIAVAHERTERILEGLHMGMGEHMTNTIVTEHGVRLTVPVGASGREFLEYITLLSGYVRQGTSLVALRFLQTCIRDALKKIFGESSSGEYDDLEPDDDIPPKKI